MPEQATETRTNGQAALRFKIASEPWEFEQIGRLNYETFVEEIPQHAPNAERVLIDKLLARSTCLIALDGPKVVGMVVIGDERPFSLDRKLPELDRYLPPHKRPCEFRLLAIERGRRGGRIFAGLAQGLWHYCRTKGYDLSVISAAGSQARLYRHLGFTAIGPAIGTKDAPYQGMYLTWDGLVETVDKLVGESDGVPLATEGGAPPVSLLPGPVDMHPDVRAALAQPPISHRSTAFRALARSVREQLAELVHAPHVQILLGSGTLGNDAVAWQLRRLGRPGVVCVNGEFGERLAGQARRAGCAIEVVDAPWGQPLPYDRIAAALASPKKPGWLWACHGETSTGVLNDLPRLKELTAPHGAKLAMDCISSLGMVPLDLRGVWMATGVSGKGLGAPAGLSLVFHAEPVTPATDMPAYLDLGSYAANDGVPFTASSILYSAIHAALRRRFAVATPGATPAIFAERVALDDWIRAQLTTVGLSVLAPPSQRLVGVLTVCVPESRPTAPLGEVLAANGFQVHYRNIYLLKRNIFQLCLMGDYTREKLAPLFALLRE